MPSLTKLKNNMFVLFHQYSIVFIVFLMTYKIKDYSVMHFKENNSFNTSNWLNKCSKNNFEVLEKELDARKVKKSARIDPKKEYLVNKNIH